MRRLLLVILCLGAAGTGRAADGERPLVLRPARVFDGLGVQAHDGWVVVVRGAKIEAVGPAGGVQDVSPTLIPEWGYPGGFGTRSGVKR